MEIINDNVLWRRANELFGRPREQWTTIDEMIYELPDYCEILPGMNAGASIYPQLATDRMDV